MKSLLINRKRDGAYRLLILMVVVCTFVAVPLLSSAHSSSASNITVSNNSSREIHFIYLSPVDQDNWGPDQLNNASLNNGQSVTLTNVSCSGADIKVIAEDKDGCFLSGVVSCGGNAQWTITDQTTADCGTE